MCLEGLLDPAEADRLGELSRPWMKAPEPNFFHLGGALNDVPELASLCLDPVILEIAEHELGEGFILANNVDVTWTEPGAPAQPLHPDVPLSWMPQPWPAFPTALQVFWMLTDYTADNGATVVVPFSHHTRRPRRDPATRRRFRRLAPKDPRSLCAPASGTDAARYQPGPAPRHGQRLLSAAVHPPSERYVAFGEAKCLRTAAGAITRNDEFCLMPTGCSRPVGLYSASGRIALFLAKIA